jgi:hypothetical protein
MVVWGGWDTTASDDAGDGRRWDPAMGWLALSTAGDPPDRREHSSVWTGTRFVVWGGETGAGVPFQTGGRYDPAMDVWAGLSVTGAPAARARHTAVWASSLATPLMLIWGGDDGQTDAQPDVVLASGGRYDPALDTWSAMAASPLSARTWHTAVWAGPVMIVFGGFTGTTGTLLGDGAQYTPGTDTWRMLGAASAPSSRAIHSAIWTGTEMIVWGGATNTGATNTGARYRP